MKLARCLTSFLAALFVGVLALRADDDDTSPSGDGSTAVDPDDAVPRAFQPKPEMTPTQRAALKAAQKRVEASHEWLMRDYQQQLESNDKKTAQADQTSLYAELSGKADLAKAAGVSPADLEDMSGGADLHTSDDRTKSTAATLRSDPTPVPTARTLFEPLLSSGTRIEPLPFAMPSPVLPTLSGAFSATTDSADDDSSLQVEGSEAARKEDPFAMDTPGMTAAESNPATRQAMGLTDADLLPGENASPEKPHRALELELPIARNSDQLQKLQDEALNVPGQLPKKPSPPAVTAPPPTPESDTEQMVRDPSPIGRHIPDPYDIIR